MIYPSVLNQIGPPPPPTPAYLVHNISHEQNCLISGIKYSVHFVQPIVIMEIHILYLLF